MGSAGTEWDIGDIGTVSRVNQKTRFVGTGTQILNIPITYAGQKAYCTATGSGFTIDHEYVRDAANTKWTDIANIKLKLIIKKASNENRTTTTFASDADFTFSAEANKDYRFKMVLYFSAMPNATKIQWTLPASATVRYFEHDPSGAIAHTTATSTLVMGAAASHYVIEGVIQAAGTAGTVALQWALNTGSGTHTLNGTDSWMEIEEF